MRHHPEHIPLLVDDPGDVSLGAIWVGVRADIAGGVRIPEDNASLALESVEHGSRGEITPVAVGNRHLQKLSSDVAVGEQRVGVFDANANGCGNELECGVSHQRPREEVRLAENLEAVADAEHRTARLGVCCYFSHDRADSRDCSVTKIVTVAEPSGKN